MSQPYPHVTVDPARNDGRPCIGDSDVRVTAIALAHEEGRSITELMAYFPSRELTLGEIYSALAYYYDNIDVLKQVAVQDRKTADDVERERLAALMRKFMGN